MDEETHSRDDLLRVAETYSTAHRHLLQLMTNRGILQARLFCKSFIGYVETCGAEGQGNNPILQPDDMDEKALIEKLIAVINNALIPISFRLVEVDDEYDDYNGYVVLLNDRKQSDLLRQASGFTVADFALFYLWVNAICNSEDGEISKQDALSAASDLSTRGKKVDEEDLLRRFISNKWLAMDEDRAIIRLDTRGIAELQVYFKKHADEFDLKKCTLCRKFIILKNRAFHCKICRSFLHRQCTLRIIKNVQTEKALCPGKLAEGQACTAELHVPYSASGQQSSEKASRKRREFDAESDDDNGSPDTEVESREKMPSSVSHSVVQLLEE